MHIKLVASIALSITVLYSGCSGKSQDKNGNSTNTGGISGGSSGTTSSPSGSSAGDTSTSPNGSASAETTALPSGSTGSQNGGSAAPETSGPGTSNPGTSASGGSTTTIPTSSGGSSESTSAAPIGTTSAPIATTSGQSGSGSCNGKTLGVYTWGENLWQNNDMDLINFMNTPLAKQWLCGDIYLNVADYTAPTEIANVQYLAPWIQMYRQQTGNVDGIIWLTYGDTESGDGAYMVTFVNTFFDWAKGISTSVASSLGTIGLSFDVEHIDPSYTQQGLQLAQSLKASTNFGANKLLVQHTIEGALNNAGTDYVMKYADSAIMMLYRNYMHDPTGTYQDDNNILTRLQWMLQSQCLYCLNDAYATANYKAQITIMVEAACDVTDYCGEISFCAYDGATEGAMYLWDTLQQMYSAMLSTNLVTPAQATRLFNPTTTFTAHDWSWFQCYAPFNSTDPSCADYHTMAATCRANK